MSRLRSQGEWLIERLLFLCAALSVLTTAGIIAVLAFETYEFFREVPVLEFREDRPLELF